MSTDGG